MSDSPTTRTLAHLRKEGWTCQSVEKWIPQANKRVDLFGCIDIVAIRDNRIVGIQTTTTSNKYMRVQKILAEPRMAEWMEAKGQLELWLWGKKGGKGKRKLWVLDVVEFCRSSHGEVRTRS